MSVKHQREKPVLPVQYDEKKDAEDNVEIEAGRFTLQSNVQQQKLILTLRDTITKKIFISSFTSSELKLCGFHPSQAQKLNSIGKVIQAAQAKSNGFRLDIKIPQVNNGEDGVQNILNNITEFRFAEVILSVQDNFFGTKSYTLKLDEVTRNPVDINAESIEDIKEDVNYMRQQIGTMTADLSVQAQHRLPKGSIISWYGAKRNIPKFWKIHEEDDNKDGDEEDEGGIKDIFTYESDFDENGIIYALGSAYGTQEWLNPSMSGIVEIRTRARMGRVSQPKDFILNREPGIVAYVNAAEYNWFTLDFKNISIRPTNYTLRHDATPNNEGHLRNWQLQGSNDGDGDVWDVLINHEYDESLNEPDGTHTWDIKDIKKFYQYFRLRMTGVASSRGWFLSCSGFEMYGEIRREDDGGNKKKFTLIKIV